VLFPKSPAADGWIVCHLAPTTWPTPHTQPRREGGKCGPRVPIGVGGAGGHDRAPMMERLQRHSGPMELHQLPHPMPPGEVGADLLLGVEGAGDDVQDLPCLRLEPEVLRRPAPRPSEGSGPAGGGMESVVMVEIK